MDSNTESNAMDIMDPAIAGIDFRQALTILADRSSCEEHDHDKKGCHTHQTKELRSMGQTIDLLENSVRTATTNNNNNEITGSTTTTTTTCDEATQKKQQQEEARQKRMQEMDAKLQTMTVKELLQLVMKTQQQRVETYQIYNKSLTTLLQSGNMTTYISTCAHTTAAFAVLSDTIIRIRSTLAKNNHHNRKNNDSYFLVKLLIQLQQHEKEKLNLTAALHLERIRERNETIAIVGKEGADPRIQTLLREGVQALTEKVTAVIEEINETMEEIRYALLEENDEHETEE